MSAHTPFMTAEALLQHWQGHRRLTRRVIDAFPDDQLFTFSIAGMRTFGALAMEILAMTVPTVRGVVSDEWIPLRDHTQRPKHELLAQWDTSTADLDRLWPQIPSQRFAETVLLQVAGREDDAAAVEEDRLHRAAALHLEVAAPPLDGEGPVSLGVCLLPEEGSTPDITRHTTRYEDH